MDVVVVVDSQVGMPCPVGTGVGNLGLGNHHVTSRVVHLVVQVLGVPTPYEVDIAHRIRIGGYHTVIRRAAVDYLYRIGQYYLTCLRLRDIYRREGAHQHQKNH